MCYIILHYIIYYIMFCYIILCYVTFFFRLRIANFIMLYGYIRLIILIPTSSAPLGSRLLQLQGLARPGGGLRLAGFGGSGLGFGVSV